MITVLEEYFQKKGKLDKAHIGNLIRAQKLEGTPEENIEMAGAFLEAVRKALEK